MTMFVFWIVGLVVASFTIIPIFIILAFGIPTTKRLEEKGLLIKGNNIINNYKRSMVLLTLVLIGAYFLINWFNPSGTIPFFIGVGSSLVFGIGQIGKNKNNVGDYLETNKAKFAVEPQVVLQSIIH